MLKQTVLRNYFKEYLKASIAEVNNKVYSGRINPMNDDKYPFIVLKTDNDVIEERYTGYTQRSLDMIIQVVVSENTDDDFDDFDEVIENLMFLVEKWMSYILTVPSDYVPENDNMRLFEDVLIQGSTKNPNIESSKDIGQGLLSYKIVYNYEDPIVPLVLEDFDYIASIQHIQLLNEGVPIND